MYNYEKQEEVSITVSFTPSNEFHKQNSIRHFPAAEAHMQSRQKTEKKVQIYVLSADIKHKHFRYGHVQLNNHTSFLTTYGISSESIDVFCLDFVTGDVVAKYGADLRIADRGSVAQHMSQPHNCFVEANFEKLLGNCFSTVQKWCGGRFRIMLRTIFFLLSLTQLGDVLNSLKMFCS